MFSDSLLLRRYRDGSQEAAGLLYQRYASRLHALARARSSTAAAARFDADDVVQSVFRRFFQAVDRGNYDLPTGQGLWSLLMVIALNRIRLEEVFQRAAKRDVRRTVGLDACPGPDLARDDFAATVVGLVVEEALSRLPEHYQIVVRLRVEGCDAAEIARRTGRSKRTVERVLQNARDELRHLLDEDATHAPPDNGGEMARS